MENALTTHFKLIDYSKNLLFNSVTDKQIEEATRLLDLAKEQEGSLFIN